MGLGRPSLFDVDQLRFLSNQTGIGRLLGKGLGNGNVAPAIVAGNFVRANETPKSLAALFFIGKNLDSCGSSRVNQFLDEAPRKGKEGRSIQNEHAMQRFWEKVGNFGRQLDNAHGIAIDCRRAESLQIQNVDSLHAHKVGVLLHGRLHFTLHFVHKGPPKKAFQLGGGSNTENTLGIDLTRHEVIHGTSILGRANGQKGVLTQKHRHGRSNGGTGVGIKVVLLCPFKHGLIVGQAVQNILRHKLGGSQPPANRVGFLFHVAKTVHLVEDARFERF
mmetsp:Transcript_10146/g.22324  ORF Transcript_10146/g.22324 Transcript_10146/m.22324 type:complete len:276 (-) Transcript_10146:764-1591(-)